MKKVIIIGGGIAGLSAGIYARQSGFDTIIYESHSIPGGASTSWRRKGYLFEGGMHWLTGSSPEKALNKLWHETGALDETVPIYVRDPFSMYEFGGKRICIYRDVEKWRTHLIEISPEDKKEINCICNDIKKFIKTDMPITDIKGVKTKNKASVNILSMLSMLPAFMRMPFYAKQSSGEYAMRYKNPLLQQLFKSIAGEENSAVATVFTLSTFMANDGGYPEGGSLGMANRMAKKFVSLDGRIIYNTKVNQVIVKNGKAVGVKIDGGEVYADAVIVTQDALVAIDTLFEEPIKESWAEKMRKETKPVLDTFISLGIKADLSAIPESIVFSLDTPIYCVGQEMQNIGINNYAVYKGYAPEGCSAITSFISGDSYDWWKKKKGNGSYEAEKEKLVETFIEALTKKIPEIDGKVEVWDVATPLTYERYLHSYKGSWMTVMGKGASMEEYPCKPQNIANLYFAGQRMKPPGGLPVALETGRKAVQYVCLDMDMVFQGNI